MGTPPLVTTDRSGQKARARIVFPLLYAAQFAFLGVQLPFFSGWLALKGFSVAEIGLVNGAALGGRLVVGPLAARFVDRLPDQRIGLILASLALFLAALTLPVASGKSVIASAAVVLLVAFGLIIPFTDAAVLHAQARGEIVYGRIRAVGSASFLIANLVAGSFLTALGMTSAAIIMASASGFGLAASFLAPPVGNVAPDAPRERLIAGFRRLIRAPRFALILAGAAFIQGSHATYYAFSVIGWSALGFAPVIIGALWASGVASEIVFLLGARRLLTRVPPEYLVLLGGLGGLVRWSIVSLEPPLAILFASQMLHALTFGATYMGAIGFIDAALDKRDANLAMTILSTLSVGAMTGIATIIAGLFFERFGASTAYGMMAVMGAAGACFGLLAVLMRRRAIPRGASRL